MPRFLSFILFSFGFMLAACSSTEQVELSELNFVGESGITAGRLTPFQQTLAAQLFNRQQGLERVAVTSFVPVNTLKQPIHKDRNSQLAQQLQEGIISIAPAYQVHVLEYRLTQGMQLADQQERALSRETDQLRTQYRFDYLVVGTYSEADTGLLVNARLVRARDASVVSAASVLVPWSTLNATKTTSQWRQDGLYREAPQGDE